MPSPKWSPPCVTLPRGDEPLTEGGARVPTADELISATVVHDLAVILSDTESSSASTWGSVHAIAEELEALSLSQRARSVAAAIIENAGSYERLAATTRSALDNAALTGWMIWPLTEAIAAMATAGAQTAEFDDGLELLAAPDSTSDRRIRSSHLSQC